MYTVKRYGKENVRNYAQSVDECGTMECPSRLNFPGVIKKYTVRTLSDYLTLP